MKLRKAGVIIMGLLTMLSVFFQGCKPAKKITDFEIVTLTEHGTAALTDEWEIQKTPAGAKFVYYSGPWEFHDDVTREDCVKKVVEGDETFYQDLLKVLTDCKLSAWDGFRKSNKGVLDGTMFSLKAVINGGETVSASGSNAYPTGYRDLKEVFYNLASYGTIRGEE